MLLPLSFYFWTDSARKKERVAGRTAQPAQVFTRQSGVLLFWGTNLHLLQTNRARFSTVYTAKGGRGSQNKQPISLNYGLMYSNNTYLYKISSGENCDGKCEIAAALRWTLEPHFLGHYCDTLRLSQVQTWPLCKSFVWITESHIGASGGAF